MKLVIDIKHRNPKYRHEYYTKHVAFAVSKSLLCKVCNRDCDPDVHTFMYLPCIRWRSDYI